MPTTKRKKPEDGSDETEKTKQGVKFRLANKGDLEIKKIETSKDKIEQPELAKPPEMVIAPLGASIIINGKSGSGKSTLLANLILKPQFYGKSPQKPKGWFDEIFLFSPTASGDDVQQALGIKKNHVYTDLDDAPELIDVILKSQKTKLAGGNKAHVVGQYCVIFDDVIGDVNFMNSKAFIQCFYMVRHANCTTIICSQHYKRVPKVCRQQASMIHFFAGSQAEVEVIVDDFAPPMYTKREFATIVNECTRSDHDFFTVCMKVGWAFRFRRNLGEFIELDRLAPSSGETSEKKKEEPKQPPQTAQICDKKGNFRENFQSAVSFYLRKHAQNEQANRLRGQSTYKGLGGGTIEERH